MAFRPTTLVDASGSDVLLSDPSGIELHDGLLYVTDNDSGLILAFTLKGQLVDFLDTELDGALRGLTFDADGDLWWWTAPRSGFSTSPPSRSGPHGQRHRWTYPRGSDTPVHAGVLA